MSWVRKISVFSFPIANKIIRSKPSAVVHLLEISIQELIEYHHVVIGKWGPGVHNF